VRHVGTNMSHYKQFIVKVNRHVRGRPVGVTWIPKQVFYGQLRDGKRLQGAPCKRYKDRLKISLTSSGLNSETLTKDASDRSKWRSMVCTGLRHFEQESNLITKRQQRKGLAPQPTSSAVNSRQFLCAECDRDCGSRIGLYSHKQDP